MASQSIRPSLKRRFLPGRRCPFASGALVLLGLAGPEAALAAGWNLYDGYTQSYSVKYQNSLQSALADNGTLLVGLNVAGSPVTVTMDTGSVGLVLSANYFPSYSTAGTPGWEYYNSSGLLLTGYFNDFKVDLDNGRDADGNPTTVSATLPVLVVTEAYCLGVGADPCDADYAVNHVSMMGVGYDRNTMGTGTLDLSLTGKELNKLLKAAPTTSEAYNVFLNIDGMAEGALRRGYIITPNGVELGLTAANTSASAFTYSQLVLESAGVDGAAPNWKSVVADITLAGTSSNADLLMDTGVYGSFFEVPGAAKGPAPAGTEITISLAGGSATYSFIVGDTSNPQTPTFVSVGSPESAFVNSGLHSYAGLNVLFDADGGFLGVAANGYSDATDVSVNQIIAATGPLVLNQDFTTDLPVLLVGDSTVITSNTATFDSAIFGPGSLTLEGGTVILNGAVTNDGGVTAASGTTVLNGSMTGDLTVASNAQFANYNNGYAVAAGNMLVNDGVFVGAGSGAAFVNVGTVTNAGTVLAAIDNSGNWTNEASASFLGGIVNSGTLTNYGDIDPGDAVTMATTFVNTGTVDNAGRIVALVDNSGSWTNSGTLIGSLANSGSFSNSGLVIGAVSNTGTMTNTGEIDGDVSAWGPFANQGTVSGTLTLYGMHHGNGSVGGLVVKEGGIVSPGNSVGAIAVSGDAVFEPGSVLAAEIGPNGIADLLSVGGTLTAGGATLVLLPTNDFQPALGNTYSVIQAGAIASAFTVASPLFGADDAPLPFLGASIDGNGVLTLGRSAVSYAGYATTANAGNAAVAADSLGLQSPLNRSLALMSAAEAPAVLASLTGEVNASAETTLQQQSIYLRDAVNRRVRQAFADIDGAAGTGNETARLAPGLDATAWSQAYGAWGNTSSDGNAEALSRSIGGFLLGADAALGADWRVGVAGGYSRSDFSLDGIGGGGSSDNYDVALYGGTQQGAMSFRFGAGYTWHDIATSRAAFTPGAEFLSADYGGGTAQLFGEAAYGFRFQNGTIEPFANLAYVNLAVDGFSESGGPAALAFGDSTMSTTYSVLGIRMAQTYDINDGMKLIAHGGLGWQHAFGDVVPEASAAFAGSSAFTVAGAPLARDAALIDAFLGLRPSSQLDFGLRYSGQIAQEASDNAVEGVLEVRF